MRPAKTAVRTTVKVADLLKVELKKETVVLANPKPEQVSTFTSEQLELSWNEFAQSRKKYQAEFQLLSQPYDVEGTKITLHLLSPVQETMLDTVKSDLTTFLRERLNNDIIQITGILNESDDKKIMYTSRDKFEYLQEKIPVLKEFKERLGLDTDF